MRKAAEISGLSTDIHGLHKMILCQELRIQNVGCGKYLLLCRNPSTLEFGVENNVRTECEKQSNRSYVQSTVLAKEKSGHTCEVYQLYELLCCCCDQKTVRETIQLVEGLL